MRVLFVLTSAARVADERTGFDRPAFATLYYGLAEGGAEIVLASPAGGAAPGAPSDEAHPLAARLHADARARAALADTLPLDAVFSGDFDGAVFPGGGGALADIAADPLAAALGQDLLDRGAPVAVVGPGGPPLQGRSLVTAADSGEALTAFLAALRD